MGFFTGLIVGCVSGPFVWELLKWGYKKLKDTVSY